MFFHLHKKLFAGLLVLLPALVSGQSFTELTSNNEGVYNGDIALADLDQSDTLDLILVGVDKLNSDILVIYKVDTSGNLIKTKQIDIPQIKNPNLQVYDITNNGLIDLVLTGTVDNKPYFNIFINKSDLIFDDYQGQLPPLNGSLVLADFSNDGLTDFIISGTQPATTDTVEFYLNDHGVFTLCDTCRTTPLKNTNFITIDISKNGFTDFITTGTDSIAAQKYYLYENRNNKQFDVSGLPIKEYRNPVLAKGDFTQNGFMDLVVSGTIEGKDSLAIYKSSGVNFEVEQGLALSGPAQKILTADFTNDGILDLLVLEDSAVILYLNDGASGYDADTISTMITNASIASGDFDRDGDQDIFITGLNGNVNSFQLLKNEYPTNKAPVEPDILYSFPRRDSVLLNWNSGSDETTSSGSLTYNVFLKGPGGSVVPVHSVFYRSLSAYGNQDMTNEIVFKHLNPGIYQWLVNAEDNSLIEKGMAVEGVGNGGNSSCISKIWEFEIKDTDDPPFVLCKGDTLELNIDPPQPVLWKSRKQGTLTFSDTLKYVASEEDVVFANYTDENCVTRTFSAYIEVKSTIPLDLKDQEICECEQFSFDLEQKFKNVSWVFKDQGDTLYGNQISFMPIQSDTLLVHAEADSLCVLSKRIAIKVNKLPDISAGEDVSIFKGESVELSATGGKSYIWLPSNGLNNNKISNPIASPKETTTYTVTGFSLDSCSNQDNVVVFVIQSVYLPNLFSPNNDGQNDSFKVYGTTVKTIELKIYDTQGKLLFESADTAGAMNTGWDGNYNGQPMPQGDYLWSISGSFQDGTKITDNGKVTGTLTLIR